MNEHQESAIAHFIATYKSIIIPLVYPKKASTRLILLLREALKDSRLTHKILFLAFPPVSSLSFSLLFPLFPPNEMTCLNSIQSKDPKTKSKFSR